MEVLIWCGKQDWILALVAARSAPFSSPTEAGFITASSSPFPKFTKKKPDAFAELSFVVRETGLDSHGSPPLGQRRSQATLWPDSLRLLQVLFFALIFLWSKIKTSVLTEVLTWCGKQDLNLHEIAFTRT